MEPVESFDSEQTAIATAKVNSAAGDKNVRPVRVLHVINGEHYSGAERVQDLLGLNLPQFGYEAAFACIKPDRFPSKRTAQEVQLFEVPMRSRFDLGVAHRLSRIARDNGFAIIHTHTPRSALVGRLAAALAQVPMIYHVHSPTSRDTTHRWRNIANQLTERASLLGVSGLITVSRSLGRHMQLMGYTDKLITVVPNGVPIPSASRDATPPQAPWQIGTVALFRPRKGLEILIQALAELRSREVPVRLRAVGPFETAEYELEIRHLAESLGVAQLIDWIGFTQDVPAELAQMDLFVLPSLFGEGLPMVVLEAMAAGVPTIGTRVEGVPEAIDDGINGLIAEPSDAGDLADRIGCVVSGEADWSALRENAIETHAAHFSAEQMARNVAGVYDRLLASRL